REQTHLAQYGCLALLWTLVFRRSHGDAALYTTAVLFATGVGLVDELGQWWTPGRVGALEDVRLDFVSALLGAGLAALVLFAGDVPLALTRRGWGRTLRGAGAVVILLGGFVAVVHVGCAIVVDPAGVRFRSRFAEPALLRRSREWTPARDGLGYL